MDYERPTDADSGVEVLLLIAGLLVGAVTFVIPSFCLVEVVIAPFGRWERLAGVVISVISATLALAVGRQIRSTVRRGSARSVDGFLPARSFFTVGFLVALGLVCLAWAVMSVVALVLAA